MRKLAADIVRLDDYRDKRDAMDRAIADIEHGFGTAAAIRDFKTRIRDLLKLGLYSDPFRARYGRRVQIIRDLPINHAIATVKFLIHQEAKTIQVAAAFGQGSPFSLYVLSELHLLLRLLRRQKVGLRGIAATVVADDDYKKQLTRKSRRRRGQ